MAKFVCGGRLAWLLWNSLLFLMRVLHGYCRHSNSILIRFYWLLLQESVLSLLSCILRKPVISILSKFNWLVATWCGMWVWRIWEQITNGFISFLSFCFPVLYFYMAHSQIFFEYVSRKIFRWYLLILMGLLTYL